MEGAGLQLDSTGHRHVAKSVCALNAICRLGRARPLCKSRLETSMQETKVLGTAGFRNACVLNLTPIMPYGLRIL